MNDENQTQALTVWHGLGIWVLLLVAEVIVAGISLIVFGFHVMVILSELIVLFVPLSFLFAMGGSLSGVISYPRRLGFGFWIWVAVATVFLLLLISDITGYVYQLVPRPEEQQKALLKVLVADSWPEYIFRLFAACVLTGFCEEFAFRGFLQSIFSKRLGAVKGFFLTAFLFAAMHLDPWSFCGVFLLGLFLGYLVHLTGNLWVAIYVHALSNGLSFSIAFFSPDVGADFSYTFPPYLMLLFTFLFLASLKLIQRMYQESQPSVVLTE